MNENPYRSGATESLRIAWIVVRTADTKDDVFNEVKGKISLAGLHDFGLNAVQNGNAPVKALIKN